MDSAGLAWGISEDAAVCPEIAVAQTPPAQPGTPDEVRFEKRTAFVRFGEIAYLLSGVTPGIVAFMRVPVRVEKEGRASPGSGKSALMELVSELAPPEDVVYLSELTPQARRRSVRSRAPRRAPPQRPARSGAGARGDPVLYAPRLAFPSERPRHRRDHDKFLRLIEASALLHQHQRERIGGTGTATIDDYRIAYELARPILSRGTETLTPQGRDLLARLRAVELLEFTRRDLVRALGWPGVRVWRTLQELLRAEAVVDLGRGTDRRRRYRVLDFFTEGDAVTRLVPPDELARMISC
jgi:hypothetical protein